MRESHGAAQTVGLASALGVHIQIHTDSIGPPKIILVLVGGRHHLKEDISLNILQVKATL